MPKPVEAAAKSIDVAAAIDDGPFGGYQKLVVGATALLIVLDGADNQLLRTPSRR